MKEENQVFFSSFMNWLQIPQKKQKRFLIELSAFFIMAVLILLFDPSGISVDVTEGLPAPRTIKSPKAISFIDERKTAELRREEESRVEPVYSLISSAEAEMLERLEIFLEDAERYYGEMKGKKNLDPDPEKLGSFFRRESLLDDDRLFQLLMISRSDFDRLKITSRQFLENLSQNVITSSNIELVRNDIKKQVDSLPGPSNYKSVMTAILRNVLTVTAMVDQKMTRQKKEAAAQAVRPVKRSFQKGQKIIDEGVAITADDIYVLNTIEKQLHKNKLFSLLGNLLLAGLLIAVSLYYLRLFKINILKNPEQFRLLASLWLMALLLGKSVYALGSYYDQPNLAILLTPLPAIGLLLTILLDVHTTLFHLMLLGMLMFVVAEANARFAIVSLLGAAVGALAWAASLRDRNMRSSIGWSGLKIGAANFIILTALLFIDAENLSAMSMSGIGQIIACGFLNGVISGVTANGMLPYIENFFSLATSSRLLELADLSQPLLKRLAEEAPGTYQHSIAVANISEAAATEINADALLVKIGAYYHDIGKLKRPMYFSENQTAKNQHDQLTPYMSSLILVGHIRDGMDLGREFFLPDRVLDLIAQHHGTTLISYFFEQAKTDVEGQLVSEERFRYPGPKPQTKEAAIVMLADSVEAAARTLPQFSHSRIEALVQKIIEHKLNDENQLDESDLTLKDIEKIEQTFVRALTSMYHGRVDYPGKLSNQPKGTADGNTN